MRAWRLLLHVLPAALREAQGGEITAMFARDLAASQPINLAQWERRALHLRLKEAFARAWQYWL